MGTVAEALRALRSCKTFVGFYASGDRYRYEYWTRDLSFSLKTLLGLGYHRQVKRQLSAIWAKQRKTGEVPTLFVNNRLVWLLKKTFRAVKMHRVPFMLEHYLGLEFFFNEWTVDSTPHALISTYEYASHTMDKSLIEKFGPNIKLALGYIKNRSTNGLLVGSDWRDTMIHQKDKVLLSNQCLLYRMYELLRKTREADYIKRRINTDFWDGDHYIDRLDSKNIDSLGLSLGVIFNIIPKDRYASVAKLLKACESRYGVRNMLIRDKNMDPDRLRIPTCDQYSVVWPFISCYAAMALNKMGYKRLAIAEMNKMSELNGFNEWYSPDSGKPLGSKNQLWTAALYLESVKDVGQI